ncbi:MAG: hypothetical protein U5L95_05145 [Candidatus Saccharibacteria bacterium]|nr:hypothetical protein [Candidatus Saccharibacteria bacterium]
MREKLKSLDRNIIILVVFAVIVIVGLAFSDGGNQAEETVNQETTAQAQEEEAGEESADENAEQQAPADEPEEQEGAAEGEKPAAEAEGEQNEDAQAQQQPAANQEEGEQSDGQYSYVAQNGDSYTEIARKAVQTYGINNNVELSEAQIVYAETTLTQEANAPLLNLGEQVSFNEDTLQSTVESATELSEDAEQNWQYYVQFVDFNTDAVGEAR